MTKRGHNENLTINFDKIFWKNVKSKMHQKSISKKKNSSWRFYVIAKINIILRIQAKWKLIQPNRVHDNVVQLIMHTILNFFFA